jgi:hypothetical protein
VGFVRALFLLLGALLKGGTLIDGRDLPRLAAGEITIW